MSKKDASLAQTWQELQACTPSLDAHNVYQYRGLLCKLISTFFTNLDSVAKSRSGARGDDKQNLIMLDFISHYVNHCPEVFVIGTSLMGDETPALLHLRATEMPSAERHSHAFTCWCISRLLRLLSHKGCEMLHEICRKTIDRLLLVIKLRDSYAFNCITSELIYVLADLVQMIAQADSTDEQLWAPWTLQRFPVTADLLKQSITDSSKSGSEDTVKVSIVEHTVVDEEACEMLQTNISLILEQHVSNIKFNDHSWNLLWGTACCQLENGETLLKSVSLSLICKMLQVGGVPCAMVRNYFLQCVLAMLDLSVHPEVSNTEAEKHELSTAPVIDQLVIKDKITEENPVPSSHMTLAELIFCLNELAKKLHDFGVSFVKTVEMKTSLARFITHLFERIPVKDLMSKVNNRAQLLQALMRDIGQIRNGQFVIIPLSSAILTELMTSSSEKSKHIQVSIKEEPMEVDEQGDCKDKKLSLHQATKLKKRSQTTDFIMDVSSASRTFKSLKKLTGRWLTEEIVPEVLSERLEGLLTVVEIALYVLLNLKDDDNSGQSKASLLSFISPDDLSKIMRFWRSFLNMCTNSDPITLDITSGLRSIVHTIGAFLAIQAKYVDTLSTDDLKEFAWILTLNWLPNDPSWQDLKPTDSSHIGLIAAALTNKIEPSIVCDSLKALALLPKDICPKWRSHVLSLAMNDSEQIACTVVRSLPATLYSLGPNSGHLITDLLYPVMSGTIKSSLVLNAIGETIGSTLCSLANTASFKLPCTVAHDCSVWEQLLITCSLCSCGTDTTVSKKSDSGMKSRRPLDINMFAPFFKLLVWETSPAKSAFVDNLHCMLQHLDLGTQTPEVKELITVCLNLIEDSDGSIRIKFSEKIGLLIASDGSSRDGVTNVEQQLVSHLKESLAMSRAQSNIRMQETILLTIGKLGRVADGELLLVVVRSLLENLLRSVPLISATAYQQIQLVAKHKGIKMQSLFLRFRQPICKFLVDTMHEARSETGGKDAEYILREVSMVMGYPDLKSFLQGAQKYLVPHLVSKATSTASGLVKLISKLLGLQSRTQLLIANTQHIFPYLLRSCQKSDLEKALLYLQSETDFELGDLLRMDFQRVHNELLLYLSRNYKQVFNGLKILASKDKAYTGPKEITCQEHMADYLQPRLLGFLAFFDSQLLNSNVPAEDKKLALESLVAILQLMGSKHITTVRIKVMATLRIGLQFKEEGFPELSCKAWNCFVRSVELSALRPMLSQIIATLLPLIEQLPKAVAEIFNFLIVENRQALQGHFHEIYFLPDIAELTDANAVLKGYTEGLSSQSDIRSKITHFLKGVSHENIDIRLHALSKLKALLHDNQTSVHQLIIGNETADSVISDLITTMIAGCRDANPKVKLLVGDCLGEIGAIDSGRLELISNNPKQDLARFKASVNDDNFAFDLISAIVRAFLAATETVIQDCSAFALQDLLQNYEIGEDREEGSSGKKLWLRFPLSVQEILMPLLHSKYRLNVQTVWSNVAKPIFQSKKGHNFKDWVTTWTGYLSSKVKQEKPQKVFASCTAVIKHDIHIALYLLPHVILYVLLDGSQQDKDEIYAEMLEVLNQVKPDTRHGSVSDFRHMSAQTVFSVLDYLMKWHRHRVQMVLVSSKIVKGEPAYVRNPEYQAVTQFLDKTDKGLLSRAAYNCKAITRALMYIELDVKNNKNDMQEHLDYLQKLYVALDEPDGVTGVAAIRQTQPTLQEQILAHESIGQLSDALACYERAIQLEPNEVGNHMGLLRCHMDLGHQSTVLTHASGILSEDLQWIGQLNAYRVEAAWKLGNWDKLHRFIKQDIRPHDHSWSVGLGHTLLAARNRDSGEFHRQVKSLREEQMGPLSAASMESGSYQRGYEFIVRLHLLNELEQALKNLLSFPPSDTQSAPLTMHDLTDRWEARLQMTQCSFRSQEPVLTLRRALFTLAQTKDETIGQEIGRSWLRSAKVARKAGHLQTAYSSLLQARYYNLPEFCLEKAKWLWVKGDHDQALVCLDQGIAEHFKNVTALKKDPSEDGKWRRLTYARALLLYGQYSEDRSSLESNLILKQYKEVADIYPEWEDGHFHIARFYDKIMTTLIDEKDRPEKMGEFTIYVVKFFSHSLMYGNQYIYQSMPRLLSLWLDYGSSVAESEKRERSKSTSQKLQTQRNMLVMINKVISNLSQQLAPYQLFTAFPQLISRICHAQPEVSVQLQEIISKLLVTFPQQAMWMMTAIAKSSYPMRVKRCQEIFAKAKSKSPALNKFIQDVTKVTDRILELCEKEVTPSMFTMSMNQHFRPLVRLLEDRNFSQILLPLQTAMTVTLPSSARSHGDHDPFPGHQVYISGFEDVIEILRSLQKPKKITLRGSDGNLYVMMCKARDDMRKDCRLMHFNAIVNKFLRKDAESRKRQLHIRTYTVVPLNEECGLVEWVNDTNGLRPILMKLYKEKGLYTSNKELHEMMPQLHSPLDKKLANYRTKLLPRHPAIFSEWFLRTFPDPTTWYMARISYARTAAVMSMTGYMLGLGDRHGENIMFDSKNGDCVHVDFNCLFNKGETFEWPERVPFRLTPNMVAAMGPMGYEGLFRQACEVTLRVMRNQSDSLMSIMKPLVYDPLVEWSQSPTGRSRPTESGEISNEQAMTHVQNIEDRLKGILKTKTKPRGLPLSIEGHVNYLIQESTDEKNLCQMYIGWAPYL